MTYDEWRKQRLLPEIKEIIPDIDTISALEGLFESAWVNGYMEGQNYGSTMGQS